MTPRSQRTISRAAEVTGFGFLTGADVRLTFHPAAANHGIAFLRTDCDSAPIPARVEHVAPRQRRTALSYRGVTVELVEHVLAALAGLQIHNCLVTLNAPEPPGLDGSCRPFAEALWDAGIVDQGVPREAMTIHHAVRAGSLEQRQWVDAMPVGADAGFTVEYTLDYGPQSPIQRQSARYLVTPEIFLREICWARTFILESEVAALRSQGYGQRVTAGDLLIFGARGVIDNALRADDECARHKLLDCIGDLALIGCDLRGTVSAFRSGHQLNAETVRQLQQSHAAQLAPVARRAA